MLVTPPRSLCVLRLSAIGDVCHAVAAVQAIQRQWPEVQITWVIGKIEAMLLQGLPGVELVLFDKRDGWRAYRNLWRTLRGRRFDVLLQMQYAIRASLASLMIRAKYRVGFDRSRAKELQWLFTNARIDPVASPHVLDGFMAFASKLGVQDLSVRWSIPVSTEDQAWARSQLSGTGAPALLICPAASKAFKNWTVAGYAAVARFAHERGFQVLLSTGPAAGEIQLAQQIIAELDFEVINLAGKSTLKQIYALIKAVDLLVAPDSGPTHMAVTAGTPVLGLYAHHNPKRTGPYLFQNYVVSVWEQEIAKQTGKSAEQLPWRGRVKDPDAMQKITIDSVLEKLGQLLDVIQTEG